MANYEYLMTSDKPVHTSEHGCPLFPPDSKVGIRRMPRHGRLIDADALKHRMTDLLWTDYVFDEVGCFGLVNVAPTVLEANE